MSSAGILSDRELGLLRAAADRLIPRDDFPAAWEGGAGAYLTAELSGDLAVRVEGLRLLTTELQTRAQCSGGSTFGRLSPCAQDSIIRSLLAEDATATYMGDLLRVAMEGYYGYAAAGAPAGWAMLGFRPVPPSVQPREVAPVVPVSVTDVRERYDTVVVGAGAGGGVAACLLAEAGQRVLLIERGQALANDQLRGDHLHGKRLAVYEVTAGPGRGHPRVIDAGDGQWLVAESHENTQEWGLNAMCLGGGTRLWQGMAWRFSAEDFAMASTYGIPPGSTVADWPIELEELEPYYWRAEEEIGVSGAPHKSSTRRTGYPMPALPYDAIRRVLGAAAARLGWDPGPIPYAINSVPRDGRPACVACPQCQGHACPVDAKNGTQNTMLRRAAATGNCDVLTAAQVTCIDGAATRHATGVNYVASDGDHEIAGSVACGRVIVSAGAVETPRVLLASGCANPWIGRNLHSHAIVIQLAQADDDPGAPVFRGPGHSVATVRFVHGAGAPFGGGVLFDAPAPLPLMAASRLPPLFGGPSWGAAHKEWMRSALPRVIGTMSIGQEIPAAGSTIDLDPAVRDRHGIPAARVRLRSTHATRQVTEFLAARCQEWLKAVGCGPARPLPMSRNQTAWAEHSSGTCRMGDDPSQSATDRLGRLHGSDNVYICDASLHPTNGSVNPGLTVIANAYRICESLSS
jgi:choline dehydrogenase-like flavoprotein